MGVRIGKRDNWPYLNEYYNGLFGKTALNNSISYFYNRRKNIFKLIYKSVISYFYKFYQIH